MAAETRSVVVRLSLENAQYIQAALQSGIAMEEGMAKGEAAVKRAEAAQKQLTQTAGKMALGTTAALAAMSKAAIDWESDWAGVTKTVSGSTQELNTLEGQLRTMATTLPASHHEIAGVAEAAGQLGVKTKDISSFTRVMIDLGNTTNLTADQAATDIAQIQNVMRTAPEDIDNFGAALVALGNNGASTEAQILGMTQRIAAAGAQVGLTEQDILGIANAAASMGLEVEAGGTAISRVFTTIAKSVATGDEKLQTFADTAGYSSAEFVQAFQDDPARAFAAFIEGLDRINKSGGDVFTTLDSIGLSDVRVSQALLSMSSAGDYLTQSLDLSSQAWDQNTALAKEAETRYNTTASQIQVAWNKIRDAGISAGNVLLPVIADIASGVGTVADAFGDLPGPVQSSLVNLLAITALTSGGLWFGAKTIRGIQAFRDGIQGISQDTPRASRAMNRMAQAAVALEALAVAGTLLDTIRDKAVGAAPSVEHLTSSLLDLGQAQSADGVTEQVGDLQGAIERLSDPGLQNKVFDSLNGYADGLGVIGSGLRGVADIGAGGGLNQAAIDSEKAAQAIDSLDQALAGIASSDADRARETFAQLAISQGLSVDQQRQLLDLLPEYRDALDASANSAKLAADASDDTTDANDRMRAAQAAAAQAARDQAQAMQDNIDAMRQAREEALRASDANLNYQESILDTRDAVKEYGRVLDRNGGLLKGQERDGIAAKRALNDQAAAWNDLSEKAKNAPGAYKAARNALIDVAEQMGYGERQAKKLADRILEIPDRRIRVEAETDSALAAVAAVKARLDALRNKTITITTVGINKGGAQLPQDYKGSADGSTVPGVRYPYGDKVPYLLAPGEEVISNRYGQADRNRALLKRINANRMADGGTVATYHGRLADGGTATVSQGLSTVASTRALNDLAKAGAESARQLREDAKQRREEMAQRRADIRSSVADGFRTDPFATDGNVWAANGGADPLGTLRADIAQARQYQRLIRRLRKRGLSGAALGEVDTLADAQALSGFGRGQLREYARLYRTRQKVTAAAGGALAAGVVGGGADLAETNRRLARLEQAVKNSAKETGRELGIEIRKATREGMDRSHR